MASSSKSTLREFEGLRGVAALMVVFDHIRRCFFPRADQWIESIAPSLAGDLLKWISHGLTNGHLAVWVFWVMSAFVLSLGFFNRCHAEPRLAYRYLRSASIRRYPRLVIPCLVSVLIAYALMVCGMMTNQDVARLLGADFVNGSLGAPYAFEPSIVEATRQSVYGMFTLDGMAHSYNPVLWTMRSELFGSMLVFGGLAVFGRTRWRIALYPVLAIILLILHLDWINGFLAGLVMCDVYVHRDELRSRVPQRLLAVGDRIAANVWVSFAAVFFVVLVAGLPYGREAPIIILSVIVCPAALILTPVRRVLSSVSVVHLGLISFSLYLTHFLLLCSLGSWILLHAGPWIASAVTLVGSLVLGIAFHVLVDRPAVVVSHRIYRLLSGPSKPNAPTAAVAGEGGKVGLIDENP